MSCSIANQPWRRGASPWWSALRSARSSWEEGSVEQGRARPLDGSGLGQAEQGPKLAGGRRRMARVMIVGEDDHRDSLGERRDDPRRLRQLGGPIDDDLVPRRGHLLDRITIADQPDEGE